MRPKFLLQFLGETTDHSSIVLEEKEVRAANASSAVQEITNVEWPTRAISLRLIDADGRPVYERWRTDIEGHI
ncbi:MAG: hypothetical protein JO012_24090 [Hyphomicrobiales bacterium]|nr:hypothetical protein [Hyphomicrobiales bacterium]